MQYCHSTSNNLWEYVKLTNLDHAPALSSKCGKRHVESRRRTLKQCCPHWVTLSICLFHVIYTWPICANSHPGNWNYITYSKSVMLPQDRAMPQATSNKCTGVKIGAVVSDTCLWSWTRHSHHSSSPTGARAMRTSHPMAWYYPVTVLTYTVRKKWTQM